MLWAVLSWGRILFSAIPHSLVLLDYILGHDVIAQAQSGTGKTATFAISILQQLNVDVGDTQALVLAPTRELAQQVINLLLEELEVRIFQFCTIFIFVQDFGHYMTCTQ